MMTAQDGRRMRKNRQQATLQWVMLDGQPRHVADFAGIPVRQRPRVTCPACERDLVLKLGSQVAHHAAHARESDCALRNPESAIHLNTKLHMAAQLRKGGAILVERQCRARADRDCEARQVGVWLQSWDQVEVEYQVETRRPDLVLLRDGERLGAIEVFVSNPVSAEKRRDLSNAGVDWIEIVGSAEFYGSHGWTPASPLSAVDAARLWECEPCKALQAEFVSIEKQRREELSRIRRTSESLASHIMGMLHGVQQEGFVAKAFRIVDVYHANGKQYREHLLVVEERSVGKVTKAVIARRRESEPPIASFASVGEGLRPAVVREKTEEYLRRFPIRDFLTEWVRFSSPEAIQKPDLLYLVEMTILGDEWRTTDPRRVHVKLVRCLLENAAAYHEVEARKYWHRGHRRWFAARRRFAEYESCVGDWQPYWPRSGSAVS